MMNNSIKITDWRRWFFLRTELDRVLTVSMLFSGALLAARILYTGRLTFLFLVWNLFLAYVPYALTNWLKYQPNRMQKKWKLVLIPVW